jgi:hypothetical protein
MLHNLQIQETASETSRRSNHIIEGLERKLAEFQNAAKVKVSSKSSIDANVVILAP